LLRVFDQVAEPIHSCIFNNEQEAQTLAALRDVLLPRLMSGSLHIPDAEELIEAVAA